MVKIDTSYADPASPGRCSYIASPGSTEDALARMLLIHQEPIASQTIAEHLREKAGAEVECTQTATEGAKMIAGGGFDLALIDAILSEIPGSQLTKLAANQNTPVLLLSESRATSAKLQQLGLPYLEQPFNLEILICESKRLMLETRSIIRTFAASADKMEFNMSILTAEIAEAHRLFDLVMIRLGYKRS